jgi:hypothetical protein
MTRTTTLTVAPRFAPPVTLPPLPACALPRRMRCVALAYRTVDGQAYRLATAEPGSVWGAVLWLSLRASWLADQLDPPAAGALRRWLDCDAEAERATAILLAGQPYFLLVPEGEVHYLLSASPEGQPSGSGC